MCGSRSHPHPATKSDCAPTEAEWKAAEAAWHQARKESAAAALAAAAARASAEEKQRIASEHLACAIGDVGEAGLQQRKEAVTEALASNTLAIEACNEALLRKSKLQDELTELTNRQNALKESVRLSSEEALRQRGGLDALYERCRILDGELAYSDDGEATHVRDDLLQRAEALRRARTEATEGVHTVTEAIAACRGRLSELASRVTTESSADLSLLKEERRALAELRISKTAEREHVALRLFGNRSALKGIDTRQRELLKAEEEYASVRALSDTASGNLAGKEKIMLETYVQLAFFDRIIARANTRFLQMSEGRYELSRKKSADNNRSRTGLDLDVIDHHNGSVRSVKTLSGGESFKAALSLALGLSDEIRSSAGGIRLDTMFVDEGFGSLDDGSLESAMATLSGLAEGDRLVGIISHVGYLKSRIGNQIVVSRTGNGASRVRIVAE